MEVGIKKDPRILIILVMSAFVVAISIVILYTFLSVAFAVSISLLIGVWFLDAILKKFFEYPNEALFADLSFASFVFFLGQQSADTLSKLQSNSGEHFSPEIQGVSLILALLILWIGNLKVCEILILPKNYSNPLTYKILFKGFSLVMSFASVIIALLPQLVEISK